MSHRRIGTRSRRSVVTALVAVTTLSLGVAVLPDPAAAAGPVQVVFVNGVNGPSSVDVYVDGVLREPALGFGDAGSILTLADSGDHDLVLFQSVGSPPAAAAARTDERIEGWSHSGMPAVEQFFHPDRAAILRLANTDRNGRWYVFTHPVAESGIACTSGFGSWTFSGSADVNAGGPGGSGSGVFGIGGATGAGTAEYERDVVVMGSRPFSDGVVEPEPFVFGSFDFGTVSFLNGRAVTYMSYGNEGRYGAAEVVYDCASETLVSARHAKRNPTFPTSRFVPLGPVRLFDTRTPAAPSGSLAPGATLDVQITGRVGIPDDDVTAVVLNVTATEAQSPGFVTVFPRGAPRPSTSSLNVSQAGQTIPNLVTVPVGSGGQVSFYSLGGIDLVADVAGYFVEADETSAGRFVPLSPTRVFDTREPGAPSGVVSGGSSIEVQLAGRAGIPASGASAAVLNLTGIGVGGPGFLTAHPHGSSVPDASNVNLLGPGDVSPNLTIVPIGDDGKIDVFSLSDAHVVGDVFGYFTDESADIDDAGLFVPTNPVRFEDTRQMPWESVDEFIAADQSIDVQIAGRADVPNDGAAAVLANLTVTQSAAAGFMTAWPSESDRTATSNLNVIGPDVTRPNAVLVPLGGPGDISVYSLTGSHAIVDVFGYFTDG